jgi:hypothetical protein
MVLPSTFANTADHRTFTPLPAVIMASARNLRRWRSWTGHDVSAGQGACVTGNGYESAKSKTIGDNPCSDPWCVHWTSRGNKLFISAPTDHARRWPSKWGNCKIGVVQGIVGGSRYEWSYATLRKVENLKQRGGEPKYCQKCVLLTVVVMCGSKIFQVKE